MAESSLDSAMKKAAGLYTSGDYQGAWDAVLSMSATDKRAALQNEAHKQLMARIKNQALVTIGGIGPQDLGLDSGAGQPSSPDSASSTALTSPPAESPADILYPKNKKGKVTF